MDSARRPLYVLLLCLLFGLPYAAVLLPLAGPALAGWKEALLGIGLVLFGAIWIRNRSFPFRVSRLDYLLLGLSGLAVLWGALNGSPAHLVSGLRYGLLPLLCYVLARAVPVRRERLDGLLRWLFWISLPALGLTMVRTSGLVVFGLFLALSVACALNKRQSPAVRIACLTLAGSLCVAGVSVALARHGMPDLQPQLAGWHWLLSHPLGSGLGSAGIGNLATGPWIVRLAHELGWPGMLFGLVGLVGVLLGVRTCEGDLYDPMDRRLLLFLLAGLALLSLAALFLPIWNDPACLSWWICFGFFLEDYFGSFPQRAKFFPIQSSE